MNPCLFWHRWTEWHNFEDDCGYLYSVRQCTRCGKVEKR